MGPLSKKGLHVAFSPSTAMQQKRRMPSLCGKLCYSLVEAVAFGKRAVRFREWAVASEPLSASQTSLLSASVRTTSLLGKDEAFSPISGMQQGTRMSWLRGKLR